MGIKEKEQIDDESDHDGIEFVIPPVISDKIQLLPVVTVPKIAEQPNVDVNDVIIIKPKKVRVKKISDHADAIMLAFD